MLALAATYADIVSVAPPSTKEGKMLLSGITMEATAARVDGIRAAAGDRFKDIELNWTITAVMPTEDREAMAEMALGAISNGYPPNIEADVTLTVQDILDSPYLAIGTYDEIADQIRRVRDRTSMSYVGIFPTQMEAFAPVIDLLKGE